MPRYTVLVFFFLAYFTLLFLRGAIYQKTHTHTQKKIQLAEKQIFLRKLLLIVGVNNPLSRDAQHLPRDRKQAHSQGLVAPLQLAPGNSRQDCYGQAVFSEKRGWMCILSSPFLGCVTLGTLPDGGASSSVRRWGWWCDSWPRPTWSICADPVAVALHVLMHFILSAAPWRLKGCA